MAVTIKNGIAWLLLGSTARHVKHEALLTQRDRATRYVNKFVLCFTTYGSQNSFSNSKSDLQSHSKALTMAPFDRPHMISY